MKAVNAVKTSIIGHNSYSNKVKVIGRPEEWVLKSPASTLAREKQLVLWGSQLHNGP
jgi:hypothetical protein